MPINQKLLSDHDIIALQLRSKLIKRLKSDPTLLIYPTFNIMQTSLLHPQSFSLLLHLKELTDQNTIEVHTFGLYIQLMNYNLTNLNDEPILKSYLNLIQDFQNNVLTMITERTEPNAQSH